MVDGREVPILRADGFFRAVQVPAGRHVVTFSYFPRIFRDSLFVSGAGALIWIAIFTASFRSRRREPGGS